MAMLCVSSPVAVSSICTSSFSSSQKNKNSRSGVVNNPFVGFSWALSKPSSFRLRNNSHGCFQVRCQDLSLVPTDQRWMFEDSEVNGADIWNTTWYPKAADHVNTDKPWYIVDATDKILGRLASTISIYIRGKNLATYTPSVDMGAFVIVINAEKVAVSGKKRTQKLYRRHSGRPGGMTVETFDQLQQRIPERIIEHAVRGMLPKGRLGRALFNHLKVYKGPDHPHEAQKPIELPIRDKRIQLER
ncbi:50S ribosomal protein L13, chloroplastic-like [Juglans microcarpa x Juglans regia]|uniref:50S ribosomal protein L13, chloroplastic-like n=1 Tax=Juglans microcarpa x Juglans regia TaxID=2249226 RepID=UPI001B7D93CC|nr:50S ribosomal protein L13, chloroplastic-like [Juglans microcarpa x Juglans regia]